VEWWDEAFRQVAPTGEIPARKSVAALTTGASLLNLDLPWQVIERTLEQKRGGAAFPIDRVDFEVLLTAAHHWVSTVKIFAGLVEKAPENRATISDERTDFTPSVAEYAHGTYKTTRPSVCDEPYWRPGETCSVCEGQAAARLEAEKHFEADVATMWFRAEAKGAELLELYRTCRDTRSAFYDLSQRRQWPHELRPHQRNKLRKASRRGEPKLLDAGFFFLQLLELRTSSEVFVQG